MARILNLLTNAFPVWVIGACAIALVWPAAFSWLPRGWIVWALGVVMLGMGITLSVDDFKRVAKMPRAVAVGFGAQFLLMPLWGWVIAQTLGLPPAMAVGLILVACAPGGTASNVISYLARANVALSVLMTMCSTAAAIVLTPVLTSWLAGAYVPVDAGGLFLSMVQVVLLPVAAGVFLHHRCPRLVRAVLPVSPLVSVIMIALICANIMSVQAAAVWESGAILLTAVALLHALGFASGYVFAKLFGYDAIIARTVSIETGMQNSGLATVLARQHFADPLTAVPGAVSAVTHSVIGSILAGLWRRSAPDTKP